MPPPGLPFRSLSWKVNTRCNYRCGYCLQPSFAEPYPADPAGTAALVCEQLAEPWEVKIAGGEVMAVPHKALEIVRVLERHGHWVSLCTNFSASVKDYGAIIEASGGRMYSFQVSLHLEYADPESFLAKCLTLRERLPSHAKLVINNVIPRGVAAIVQLGEIKRRFEGEGLVFYTDLRVDERGLYLAYDPAERDAIDAALGVEERRFVSRDRLCRAGDSYFALLPNLDVWACWDAYLRDMRSMYLGNMRAGTFSLDSATKRGAQTARRCPFDTCSCPTPLIKHTFKLAANGAGG